MHWTFIGQVERGRELGGLIAEGGERLALALAATTEAELWTAYRAAPQPALGGLGLMERRSVTAGQEMSQRAMAELASYYLLATGHILANATARTLALHTDLHPTLFDLFGSWYPVGSSETKDWLSLNRDTARQLRKATKKVGNSAAQGLAEPISQLLMAPAWTELDQIRGAHYHRRRPQSAGLDGVPLASGWTFTSEASHFNLGGTGYIDGDGLGQAATTLARRVLDELRIVMPQLLSQIHLVIEEIKQQ